MMKPVILLMVLFFSANSYSVCAQSPRKKQKNEKGNNRNIENPSVTNINVLVGAPDRNAVVLNLLSPEEATASIEYSTTANYFNNHTSNFHLSANQPTEKLISYLQSGTKYYYRIRYQYNSDKQDHLTPISVFTTQQTKGTSFVFGVQGDSHPEREGKMFNAALYYQTIDSVNARNPAFYFMMGDDFSLDRFMRSGNLNKDAVESVYRLQRTYWGNMGKNVPLFLVNGNHEQAARYLLNGSPDNFAVFAANARKKYFPLPEPSGIYSGDTGWVQHIGLLKDYYAFEWGDALFVVIDPYWHSTVPVDNVPTEERKEKNKQPWDITLGDEQYAWLKKTLETSKSKFKFVFAHHVNGTGRGGVERAKYYEWGGYNQRNQWEFASYRPKWELPIHQLMVKNKVTIFFQGHDHLFAHQELDGIVYQSVPNPADDTYTAFNADSYLSGKVLPNSGFLQVKVSGENVQVEYVRVQLAGKMNTSPENSNYTYTIEYKKGR